MNEKVFRHHAENENIRVDYNFHPGCVVEMNVVVSQKGSEAAYHRAMKEIRREVSLPGFRKGHVPEDILTKNFSKQVEENFTDVLRSVSFTEASKLIKKVPFSKYFRKIAVKKSARDSSSELYFEYEAAPQVPEVDLSTIQIKPVAPSEPTEKEVSFFLLRLRFAWSEKKPQEERLAAENDSVTLSLTATVNGEKRVVESEKELLLSKELFPEWLYASILGMKKGEEKQVNHPEEKNEDGSPVVYSINVAGVAECSLLPEDDTFAAKWHYESLAKFKEAIVNMLQLQYKAIAQDKMRRQLRNELIRLYAFDLPQSLVEAETEGRYQAFVKSVPEHKQADRDEERKPFLDTVKRYFTCLYLLQPFYEFVSKDISPEELSREYTYQIQELPFTQRMLLPEMQQEDLVRRLMTAICLRRAEDYCLQKIIGTATMNAEQQKELLETDLPVELHESIGVSHTAE